MGTLDFITPNALVGSRAGFLGPSHTVGLTMCRGNHWRGRNQQILLANIISPIQGIGHQSKHAPIQKGRLLTESLISTPTNPLLTTQKHNNGKKRAEFADKCKIWSGCDKPNDKKRKVNRLPLELQNERPSLEHKAMEPIDCFGRNLFRCYPSAYILTPTELNKRLPFHPSRQERVDRRLLLKPVEEHNHLLLADTPREVLHVHHAVLFTTLVLQEYSPANSHISHLREFHHLVRTESIRLDLRIRNDHRLLFLLLILQWCVHIQKRLC